MSAFNIDAVLSFLAQLLKSSSQLLAEDFMFISHKQIIR